MKKTRAEIIRDALADRAEALRKETDSRAMFWKPYHDKKWFGVPSEELHAERLKIEKMLQ